MTTPLKRIQTVKNALPATNYALKEIDKNFTNLPAAAGGGGSVSGNLECLVCCTSITSPPTQTYSGAAYVQIPINTQLYLNSPSGILTFDSINYYWRINNTTGADTYWVFVVGRGASTYDPNAGSGGYTGYVLLYRNSTSREIFHSTWSTSTTAGYGPSSYGHSMLVRVRNADNYIFSPYIYTVYFSGTSYQYGPGEIWACIYQVG